MQPKVLVMGNSLLADRVLAGLQLMGHETVHIPEDFFHPDAHHYLIDRVREALKAFDLGRLQMAYVLDEVDEHNLQLIIALVTLHKELRITAALFNEHIIPYLEHAHPHLRILNPARIAAPAFVEAIYGPSHLPITPHAKPLVKPFHPIQTDNFIYRLAGLFAMVLAVATAYFHFADGLSWLNAAYFVITTVTTVGYGDITLLNASTASKVFGMLLIVLSTIFIWTIFSLTVDRIIKNRVQRALGRRHYRFREHIIICGLGRLGFFVADALRRKGERIVIIEEKEDAPNIKYFRHHNVPVYIGNARNPAVLHDAGVSKARALVSLIDNDYGNLEIGLSARSFQPKLRVILRVFDNSMSETIREKLDIHLTASLSGIAQEAFLAELNRAQHTGTP